MLPATSCERALTAGVTIETWGSRLLRRILDSQRVGSAIARSTLTPRFGRRHNKQQIRSCSQSALHGS